MPQFFSYPYNYNELSNYVKDKDTENAAKVSDNNHDSFVEINTSDEEAERKIKFTFSKENKVNAIFILAENINFVDGGGLSGLDELEPRSGDKQYLYQKLDTPQTIDNMSGLELTFDSPSVGKVYEVLLLEEYEDLKYYTPILNYREMVSRLSKNRKDELDAKLANQPVSSFSEVQLVQTQEGVGVHEDIYGHRTEYRQYGYRPKYQITYTAPLQTLEEVRSLQRFRENNLNFTFAQDLKIYPSRIFPCHFSDFSLPISYTLPHIAQAERYTVKFTIQEN